MPSVAGGSHNVNASISVMDHMDMGARDGGTSVVVHKKLNFVIGCHA